MLERILRIIAPHECLGCTAEGALLCSVCMSAQQPAVSRCYRCHQPAEAFRTCDFCQARSPLSALHAVYRYEEHAKNLVWKLKFGRARSAAEEMATAMMPVLSRIDTERMIITHAPTATTRVRMRGYDQASLIARSLARQGGLPYAPLLVRSGQRKQVGASRAIRLQQLSGSFRPVRPRYVRGATVLLVDDVTTTGSTLQSAAAALKMAGAERVEAVVFAQA